MELIDFRKETDTWVLFKLLDNKDGKLIHNSKLQNVQNMIDKGKNLMMVYCDVSGFEYFEVLFRDGQLTNFMRPIRTKRHLRNTWSI